MPRTWQREKELGTCLSSQQILAHHPQMLTDSNHRDHASHSSPFSNLDSSFLDTHAGRQRAIPPVTGSCHLDCMPDPGLALTRTEPVWAFRHSESTTMSVISAFVSLSLPPRSFYLSLSLK